MTSERILGAVLAGGKSSRFGSDKAVAMLDGRRLIDRVFDSLAAQCDDVVIVGRDGGVPDWPAPGLGPLGGLAGALRHARVAGYDAILSAAVDSVGLPPDLLARLAPAPAFVGSQPVVGFWPVTALPALEAILTGAGKHSVKRFAQAIGARPVTLPQPIANINRPEDLARIEPAQD